MKVLYHFEITPDEKEELRSLLDDGVDIVFSEPGKVTDEELARMMEDVKVLVGFHVPKEVLLSGKALTNVIIPFAGVPKRDQERFKDPELCNITVSNLHFNSDAVAEQFFALLLALAKGVVMYDRALRKGDWTSRYEQVDAIALKGKTLGILGLGAIGKAVASRARAFGMRIMATKRTVRPGEEALKERYGLSFLGSKEDQDKVLGGSDVVLLSLPSTDDMKDSFGEREFGLMRPNALLVNMARGSIIVEEVLYNALKGRRIRGYGADVWFNYPKKKEDWGRTLPSKLPIHELDNVIMSPHRSYLIPEREGYRIAEVAEEINRVARGEGVQNIVDKELGY